jgi:hypothetical protein
MTRLLKEGDFAASRDPQSLAFGGALSVAGLRRAGRHRRVSTTT